MLPQGRGGGRRDNQIEAYCEAVPVLENQTITELGIETAVHYVLAFIIGKGIVKLYESVAGHLDAFDPDGFTAEIRVFDDNSAFGYFPTLFCLGCRA